MCFAVESAVKCLLAKRKLCSVYKCTWLSLPAAACRSCNGKYSIHLDMLFYRCCYLLLEEYDTKKFHTFNPRLIERVHLTVGRPWWARSVPLGHLSHALGLCVSSPPCHSLCINEGSRPKLISRRLGGSLLVYL